MSWIRKVRNILEKYCEVEEHGDHIVVRCRLCGYVMTVRNRREMYNVVYSHFRFATGLEHRKDYIKMRNIHYLHLVKA